MGAVLPESVPGQGLPLTPLPWPLFLPGPQQSCPSNTLLARVAVPGSASGGPTWRHRDSLVTSAHLLVLVSCRSQALWVRSICPPSCVPRLAWSGAPRGWRQRTSRRWPPAPRPSPSSQPPGAPRCRTELAAAAPPPTSRRRWRQMSGTQAPQTGSGPMPAQAGPALWTGSPGGRGHRPSAGACSRWVDTGPDVLVPGVPPDSREGRSGTDRNRAVAGEEGLGRAKAERNGCPPRPPSP